MSADGDFDVHLGIESSGSNAVVPKEAQPSTADDSFICRFKAFDFIFAFGLGFDTLTHMAHHFLGAIVFTM